MQKWFLTIIIGLFLGSGAAFSFLWMLPRLDLPRDHQLYQVFGVIKPIVLGFQPYWLLAQADKDYAPYLSDITYFGVVLNGDGSIQQRVNAKEEEPGWTRLRSEAVEVLLAKAKKSNQHTSLLVHTGQEAVVEKLITSPEESAQTLIAEVEPIMKMYGFTDLNVDIESFQSASPSAQQAFTAFTKELKQGLTEKKLGTLTIEVLPSALTYDLLINPAEVGAVADRVVLMAYDYHYRGSYIAGPVAPIGGAGEVREYDVETTLKLLTQVVPKEKILLGIPLYGYEWETLERYPQAPAIPGSGKTSSHRRAEELLASCVHCIKELQPLSLQPYLILPQTEEGYTQQIFYEDEESLQKKLELAKKYELGGVALWAIGYEGKDMLRPLQEYKRSYRWR